MRLEKENSRGNFLTQWKIIYQYEPSEIRLNVSHGTDLGRKLLLFKIVSNLSEKFGQKLIHPKTQFFLVVAVAVIAL